MRVLTFDEARRIAVNVAKLPGPSAARSNRSWDGCYPFVLHAAKEPAPSLIPARSRARGDDRQANQPSRIGLASSNL
jgi:hypothetical protein